MEQFKESLARDASQKEQIATLEECLAKEQALNHRIHVDEYVSSLCQKAYFSFHNNSQRLDNQVVLSRLDSLDRRDGQIKQLSEQVHELQRNYALEREKNGHLQELASNSEAQFKQLESDHAALKSQLKEHQY